MKSMWFEDSRHPVKRLPGGGLLEDDSKVIVISEMLYRCYRDNEKIKFLNGIEFLKDSLKSILVYTIEIELN